MIVDLKTALHNAQSFQELLPIANELHAGLSWWGYQYAYVPTSTSTDKEVIYTGRVAIGTIAEKALKIRQEMEKNKKRFTANEADSVYPFFRKIYCLYAEDKGLCNQANPLTTICRLVVSLFFKDHQFDWGNAWEYGKFETYTDKICKGLPKNIGWRALKGEITQDFIRNLRNWEKQGATFIPYPNGT